MKNLKYKIACKSCLRTDGIIRMKMISDRFSDFFESNRLKSEYSLGQYILSFLKESDQGCDFCGSYNLEISDIEFDGRRAMITRDIDQFQLIISKQENGMIDIKTGGSEYLPYGFLNEALNSLKMLLSLQMRRNLKKSILAMFALLFPLDF